MCISKKLYKNQDCFTSEAALKKQLRKLSAFALQAFSD